MQADGAITSLHGYTILGVKLPIQPSCKELAVHYLYLRRHEPKVPTPEDERTLFVVNIPIDATEAHFRELFTALGGGRVLSVKFEGARSISKPAVAPAVPSKTEERKKKRKRDEAKANEEMAELPDVWDRQLHRSGGTGLIVFVDVAALNASIKAISKRRKVPVRWGDNVEDKIPALGSHRAKPLTSGLSLALLMIEARYRISDTSPPSISISNISSGLHR